MIKFCLPLLAIVSFANCAFAFVIDEGYEDVKSGHVIKRIGIRGEEDLQSLNRAQKTKVAETEAQHSADLSCLSRKATRVTGWTIELENGGCFTDIPHDGRYNPCEDVVVSALFRCR